MEHMHEREILARFKLAIAEENLANLFKILNDEEINFVLNSVNELGYDINVIKRFIPKKEEIIKVEKVELPNSIEEYIKNRRMGRI